MGLKTQVLVFCAFLFISSSAKMVGYSSEKIFNNLEVITSENASSVTLLDVKELPSLGIKCIVFNYNGTLMGVAANEFIYLFDTTSMEIVKVIESEQGKINDLEASKTNNVIVAASDNGSISMWDLDNENYAVFSNASNNEIITVSISSDTKILASSGYDKAIALWDFETQRLIDRLENNVVDEVYGISEINITTLDFSPQNYLIAAGGGSPIIFLYDATTYELLWETEWDINTPRNLDTSGMITDITFTPDGRNVAYSYLGSVAQGSYIRVLDVLNGDLIIELKDNNYNVSEVRTIKFNPTGDILAGGEYPLDGETQEDQVYLWDWARGEILTTLGGHQNHVEDIAFNPSGTILVTSDDSSKLFIWGIEENN